MKQFVADIYLSLFVYFGSKLFDKISIYPVKIWGEDVVGVIHFYSHEKILFESAEKLLKLKKENEYGPS